MGVFSFLHGHKILKIICLIISILIAAFIVLMAVIVVRSWWSGYQWQKKADNYQAEMEKPYREDTYGGKTPEQTWAMFLSALKQGDVEQASKYVAVDKREDVRDRLQESIRINRLSSAIEKFSGELKKERNYLQDDNAYYYIPIKNSSGETEAYPIVFYLNPFTKVWKILVL